MLLLAITHHRPASAQKGGGLVKARIGMPKIQQLDAGDIIKPLRSILNGTVNEALRERVHHGLLAPFGAAAWASGRDCLSTQLSVGSKSSKKMPNPKAMKPEPKMTESRAHAHWVEHQGSCYTPTWTYICIYID